jgi:hypothetical protein
MGIQNEYEKLDCKGRRIDETLPSYCRISNKQRFEAISGGFGGFNRSLELTSLPPDSLANEFISFSV